jgi:hypothetical protein
VAVARPFGSYLDRENDISRISESRRRLNRIACTEGRTRQRRTPAAVESASNAASQTATAVTITGCVANDEETFWLKDTSGADAPKSRNWKSGFSERNARRRSRSSMRTHALKLPNYVGQRVAATGTLVNREMRAQSLQRVGSSCS